jgi:putative salt-induced outer membrane protein YdiY
MRKIFLFILLPICSFGQIINVENKRLSSDEDGFSGSFNLGLNLIKNTSQILQFNNNVHLQYSKNKSTYLFLNDISFVQKEGEEDWLNKGYQHFRYIYQDKKLGYEGFIQHQYDKAQKIELRLLAGVGARWQLVKNDSLQFALGLSTMNEYENPADGDPFVQIRLSHYLTFSFQVNENISLSTTNYYQPLLTSWGDYRMSSQTALKLAINKQFEFKIAGNVTYDSRPAEGVPLLNYHVVNGIAYKF